MRETNRLKLLIRDKHYLLDSGSRCTYAVFQVMFNNVTFWCAICRDTDRYCFPESD